MNWKPIETAPKDGTFVLLCEWSGFIHIAQWCRDGYWRTQVDRGNLDWHPIGWMHLPQPMMVPR